MGPRGWRQRAGWEKMLERRPDPAGRWMPSQEAWAQQSENLWISESSSMWEAEPGPLQPRSFVLFYLFIYF